MDNPDPNKLSEQLLLHVKMEEDSGTIQSQLQQFSWQTLTQHLLNDDKKKAFWINLYNAYFLILRKERKVTKPAIFKSKLINIAGKLFSLDDIEHGILRKYRHKYSLGLLGNIFTPKLIKWLAVDELDYRIHFALNCGAKSCPPIAFYNDNKINAQLDLATQSFLESESDIDDENKVVHTTALFKWYYGDFAGTKGIKSIFQDHLGKDISAYKIKYNEYSWEENLDNFTRLR